MHVIANRLQEGGAAPHRLQKKTNDPGSVEPRRTCTRHRSTRRKASPKQLSADGDSLWGYRRRSRIGSIPWPVPDRGAWNPARPRPRGSTQDPRRASEKTRLEGRITPFFLRVAEQGQRKSRTEAFTAEGTRSDLIFASKSFNPPMIQSINHTISRSFNLSISQFLTAGARRDGDLYSPPPSFHRIFTVSSHPLHKSELHSFPGRK